jgi:hypothetical protein
MGCVHTQRDRARCNQWRITYRKLWDLTNRFRKPTNSCCNVVRWTCYAFLVESWSSLAFVSALSMVTSSAFAACTHDERGVVVGGYWMATCRGWWSPCWVGDYLGPIIMYEHIFSLFLSKPMHLFVDSTRCRCMRWIFKSILENLFDSRCCSWLIRYNALSVFFSLQWSCGIFPAVKRDQ